MTTRSLMLLVAEAAAVLALAALMDGLPLLANFGLLATWIVGMAAYLVRLAERSSSLSGRATLGRIAVAVAVVLGVSVFIPPPIVPLIALSLLAVAMVIEGYRGWVPSRVLITSGGLVFLAWLVRVMSPSLRAALSLG